LPALQLEYANSNKLAAQGARPVIISLGCALTVPVATHKVQQAFAFASTIALTVKLVAAIY